MKNKEKNYTYRTLRNICRPLMKLLYRPQIYGKENIPSNGAIIFAGNHIHAFDPVTVATPTKRIVHFMAKEELFRGLHGMLLKKMGIIKVDRSKKNPVAILEAERILSSGGAVGIFPEGTRNRTEKELLKFKTGSVKMAKNTNTKIIPFAIKGEYKMFKKGLTIEYGKPIDISQMEIEEANDYLKNEILQLLRNRNEK